MGTDRFNLTRGGRGFSGMVWVGLGCGACGGDVFGDEDDGMEMDWSLILTKEDATFFIRELGATYDGFQDEDREERREGRGGEGEKGLI